MVSVTGYAVVGRESNVEELEAIVGEGYGSGEGDEDDGDGAEDFEGRHSGFVRNWL